MSDPQIDPGDEAVRHPLSRPAVDPNLYDEAYYREACAGSEEWSSSRGALVAEIYSYVLARVGLGAGEVLVDIGAGRGELVALAIKRGAARAVGVEYAEAAVRLAVQTLEAQGVTGKAEVILADARAIPLPSETADVVTLLDVVEHLTAPELSAALGQAFRLLKPGGRLLIHTFPNRSIYEITYRLQRMALPSRRRRWPLDPRVEFERLMHVNEQTVTSLRRVLVAGGFADLQVSLGTWIYTDFVPDEAAKKLYHRLARVPPLARLGAGNIWAEARRPGRSAQPPGPRQQSAPPGSPRGRV